MKEKEKRIQTLFDRFNAGGMTLNAYLSTIKHPRNSWTHLNQTALAVSLTRLSLLRRGGYLSLTGVQGRREVSSNTKVEYQH